MSETCKNLDTRIKEKPLLAYAVLEKGEDTGGIIFARSNIEARKRGSCEWSDGDISSVSCRRAHWADAYATVGVIEATAAVEQGWHFECHGCGMSIDSYSIEDQGMDVQGIIGAMDSWIFCCIECKDRSDKIEAQKKAFGASFLDELRRMITRRFGDVEICGASDDAFFPHVYVIEQDGAFSIGQANVHFHFPGQKLAPATIKYEWPYSSRWDGIGPQRPYFTCCHGDVEAFQAFAFETKKRNQ